MRLSFGEKMRVIMKRRGVSVQDLADRLGVSRQNVNQRLNADRFTLDEIRRRHWLRYRNRDNRPAGGRSRSTYK